MFCTDHSVIGGYALNMLYLTMCHSNYHVNSSYYAELAMLKLFHIGCHCQSGKMFRHILLLLDHQDQWWQLSCLATGHGPISIPKEVSGSSGWPPEGCLPGMSDGRYPVMAMKPNFGHPCFLYFALVCLTQWLTCWLRRACHILVMFWILLHISSV